MAEVFENLDDAPETRRLVAASVAIEQCRALHAGGVRQFHFYTLNRAELAFAICHVLGVRPWQDIDRRPEAVQRSAEAPT